MRLSFLALATIPSLITAAHADCTSEVNDAFAKLRKSTAFTMETTITNPQGTLTMSNDYVLPDRMHQTVSMGANGPGEMEMILVAGKAWSNQGNQGWAEVPEKFATTIAKQMKDTVVEPPKDESQFDCLGDVTSLSFCATVAGQSEDRFGPRQYHRYRPSHGGTGTAEALHQRPLARGQQLVHRLNHGGGRQCGGQTVGS